MKKYLRLKYDPLRLLIKENEDERIAYALGYEAGCKFIADRKLTQSSKLRNKLLDQLQFSAINAVEKWNNKEKAALFALYMRDAQKMVKMILKSK